MITKQKLIEVTLSGRPMYTPEDADYRTELSVLSATSSCEISAVQKPNVYVNERLTFSMSMELSRMNGEHSDSQIMQQKIKLAEGMHHDLYGDVISKVHHAIYSCEVGSTRADTLNVLRKLLVELEK